MQSTLLLLFWVKAQILDLIPSALATCSVKPLVYPPNVVDSIDAFRKAYPYSPGPLRRGPVITIRASAHAADDVSGEFRAGLERANHGGTLHLLPNATYVIGRPLDLSFLDDIEVRLDGTVRFTENVTYWQTPGNLFSYPFQNATSFWRWGGRDVRIYGRGTLDGNGHKWWDAYVGQSTSTFLRPILYFANNMNNFRVEGIHLMNSPIWHQLYVYSKNITLTNLVTTAVSNSSAYIYNTDFFDSLNIDQVEVSKIWVSIGDGKPMAVSHTRTDIHVDTIYCNGTHGQSIGSIGEYAPLYSTIANVTISNVWMFNGANGPRIKTWAGPGTGTGIVYNITFRNFWLGNSDLATQLDACYFDIDPAECAAYPSQVNVSDVWLENIAGSTSSRYGREVAVFSCSTNPDAVCDSFSLVNFNVTSPCDGPAIVVCDGIKGGLGVDCYSATANVSVAAAADTC